MTVPALMAVFTEQLKGNNMTTKKQATKEPKREMVDHPAHYQGNGIEAIDVIEAFDLGFCLGNTVKYVLRTGRKTATKEGKLEDLKKAQWYLARAMEEISGKRGAATATPATEEPVDDEERVATDAEVVRRINGDPVYAGRRDPDVLARLRKRLRDVIVKNPGMRVEEINAHLKTKTADVTLPLKQLTASKVITTKGDRRTTTYWPSSETLKAQPAPKKKGAKK